MSARSTLDEAARAQAILIAALQDGACYPHPVDRVRALETHISHVLLTGPFAYKIKKPVKLGFLDFGTLEKRRHYCEEELRLNRRLAPALYLSVVAITGTPDAPRIGGSGQAIEYAVKMVEFPQDALLDRRLARGEPLATNIDALADLVAGFHDRIARAAPDSKFGTPAAVWAPMAQNFSQLGDYLPGTTWATRLKPLAVWSRQQLSRCTSLIEARRRGGRVRECHGDLHPGNVAVVDEQPRIFDCIEFNPAFRWIDVIDEVAFMAMDLSVHGRPDYGHRFVNRYLESTGDYEGVELLDFYKVYRALVRAKVAAIRAAQEDSASRRHDMASCARYIDFAEQAMRPASPGLILMYGLSGAGKTHVSQLLLEQTGAIRLRSDVERKRLAGLARLAASGSPVQGGIYEHEATVATYRQLAELARRILHAGYPVVIDATSLHAWQRRLFRELADEQAVPFLIVACHASEVTLHRRLAKRHQGMADASEANGNVLDHQLRTMDPLDESERRASLPVNTEQLTPAELFRTLAGAFVSARPP